MKRKIWSLVLILSTVTTFFTACSKAEINTTNDITPTTTASSTPPIATVTKSVQNETDEAKLQPAELYIFIAASLSNALTELQEIYREKQPNVTLFFNADSSSTLKTQIEEGATCNIFFSAAMKQMNELDALGLIETSTKTPLLENKVVLIKPSNSSTLVTNFDNIFNAKNIALAGADVPVGAYAREIFNTLGITDKVEALEINQCANVTAVLTSISEGSNEVGIVYATDANSVKDKVEIIATASSDSLKTPVLYPVAAVKQTSSTEEIKAASDDFLSFLTSEEAIRVFESYGFTYNVE